MRTVFLSCFVSVIFAAFLCAQSQKGPGSGEKIGYPKNNQTESKQQQPTNSPDTPTLDSPPPEKPKTNPKATRGRQNEGQDSTNDLSKWWNDPDWWTVWLTLGILVLLIAHAVIFGFQARANIIAANAAETAAIAAKNQAHLAMEELHRSHRAWLRPADLTDVSASLRIGAGEAVIKVDFSVTNSGSSPALMAIIIQRLIIGPIPHPDPRQYTATPNTSVQQKLTAGFGRIILPNSTVPWRFESITPRVDFQDKGSAFVSVWLNGYISYLDEFDIPHTTTFLYRFETMNGKREISPSGRIRGRLTAMGYGWTAT